MASFIAICTETGKVDAKLTCIMQLIYAGFVSGLRVQTYTTKT